MQYRLINLDALGIMVFSVLVLLMSTALSESYAAPLSAEGDGILLAEQRNPWLLPEKVEEPGKFGGRSLSRKNPPPQEQSENQSYQWGKQQRFVTPEILESLKRQQTQMQQLQQSAPLYQRNAPSTNHGLQGYPSPAAPRPSYSPWGSGTVPTYNEWQSPGSSLPGSTTPGFAMQGLPTPRSPMTGSPLPDAMGFSNPLYDVPSVSPWANDIDLLYRGESMPWVPDEAVGGIPPMPVSPYLGQELGNYPFADDTVGAEKSAGELHQSPENNVFNPFTFIPNKDLQ